MSIINKDYEKLISDFDVNFWVIALFFFQLHKRFNGPSEEVIKIEYIIL